MGDASLFSKALSLLCGGVLIRTPFKAFLQSTSFRRDSPEEVGSATASFVAKVLAGHIR
jgi:hypothetical protein